MGNTFRGGQDNPHRKALIRFGESTRELPNLSIQCFESRHYDCIGVVHGIIRDQSGTEPANKCECKCHAKGGDID